MSRRRSDRQWSVRADDQGEVVVYKRSAWLDDVFSISDLVAYCIERNLSLDEVRITKPTLHYESPETDKERENREHFAREQAARTEQWERETYLRLKAKYEA